MIDVDYEPLQAVTGTADAVAPGAPPVWDACPDNQAFFHEVGNRAAVDAAFASAAHVVRHRLVINRLAPNSMEPRGCLAEYDASEERYIIHCTVQAPHRIRALLANQVLRRQDKSAEPFLSKIHLGFCFR